MFLVLLDPSLPGIFHHLFYQLVLISAVQAGFMRAVLSWIGVNVLGGKYLPPVLKDSRRISVKELYKI